MSAATPGMEARVLELIKSASAQKPARAEDLVAQAGGPEPEFWAALERLAASSQVNSAQIQRASDPGAWLAIWPTGICRHVGGWKGESHSVLFTPTRTQRQIIREVSGPKVQPPRAGREPPQEVVKPFVARPRARRQRSAGETQAEVIALLEGRGAFSALTRRDIAIALGAGGKNPLATYSRYIKLALAQAPWVASVDRCGRDARGAGHRSEALYDGRTLATQANAGPAPEPPSVPEPETAPPVPAGPDRPRNDTVAAHLEPDGALTVVFGPDYATERCIVHVQALRRELRFEAAP